MKIAMHDMKRVKVLRDITWDNADLPTQTLPAGWEGWITRHRPGSASALLEDGTGKPCGEFAICDCFLEDGSVEEADY